MRSTSDTSLTVVTTTLVIALGAVMLVSLCVGRYPVPLSHVLGILASAGTGGGPDNPAWTQTEWIVVTSVRLPRILGAVLAGLGLGLSGAALQGIFRNPLVGPQIVGVSSGAAWGGVLGILLGLSSVGIVASAFVFGLVALLAAFGLNAISRGGGVLAIVLAGVLVSSFFSALVGFAQFIADSERQLPSIVFWLLGSFATVSGQSVIIIGIPTLAAGVFLWLLRWRINLLSLGDVDAAALGVPVQSLRWAILLLVTLIVAAQVSVSGVIGWVGLVMPHLARGLVGPNHRRLLPTAALLGAIYLLAIDDVARSVSAQEIPLGVLTALIGTPIFGVVYWRSRSMGWSGG